MKTITKKEQLQNIKEDIEKGLNFIKSEKVIISVNFGSMGIKEINKNIGSDLCYIRNALDKLNNFMENKKIMRV